MANLLEFLLAASLGAASATVGSVLLVTLRVAFSPRRRRFAAYLLRTGSRTVPMVRTLLTARADELDGQLPLLRASDCR